ncbi:MAG: NAD-dependent epimerase/dehydratase family protein [Acidimicrobiia bacterium]
MSRKAIVSGGAGFIGSHLVDFLVDRDWELLLVDDLTKGKLEYVADARRRGRVTVHLMDIRAEEMVDAAVRFEPEVVFHLAAQPAVRASVDDPVHDAGVNVLGTVNVLNAAAASGAKRVVFASSGGAIYGPRARLPVTERSSKRPHSPYGISKKVVEDYFRWYRDAHGIEYVLLALANVYGPRQDSSAEGGVVAIFSRAMLEGRKPTIFGDGTQTRDFIYASDVVDAFYRAVDWGDARLFNIGTGKETSVLELFEILADLTGYEAGPEFGEPQPGEIPRSVVDPSAAERGLGWKPWTELEDGLRRTIAWFRGKPS